MNHAKQTGAQRAAIRLAAKVRANADFYASLPEIVPRTLRQWRRREERKEAKRMRGRDPRTGLKPHQLMRRARVMSEH